MMKFWRVITHEYGRHVLRKRFFLGLLSLPLMIVLMIGVIILLEIGQVTLGYVDHSDFLANPVQLPRPESPEKPIVLIAYPDEESAQSALDDGEVEAYYILADDFPLSGRAELVYYKEPKGYALSQFSEYIVANLLVTQPPEIADRVMAGNNFVVRTVDGKRQVSQQDWFSIMLPIFAALAFFIAIMTSSGYLMQAVVDEKENRTMEILVTSVSPMQLMIGKVIGNIGVGLTQLLAWLLFLVIVVAVGGFYLPPLQSIRVPFDTLLILFLVLMPAFVMISGLLAALGATVSESREAQQMTGLIVMPFWLPYFVFPIFLNNPNSPLAVALTLIPVTAPMSIILRMGFAEVPAWQLVISLLLLIASAVGSLWLAGRAFRMGMLMYGKRLPLKRLFSFRKRGAA